MNGQIILLLLLSARESDLSLRPHFHLPLYCVQHTLSLPQSYLLQIQVLLHLRDFLSKLVHCQSFISQIVLPVALSKLQLLVVLHQLLLLLLQVVYLVLIFEFLFSVLLLFFLNLLCQDLLDFLQLPKFLYLLLENPFVLVNLFFLVLNLLRVVVISLIQNVLSVTNFTNESLRSFLTQNKGLSGISSLFMETVRTSNVSAEGAVMRVLAF